MARLLLAIILISGSAFAQENFKREMYLGNYYFDQKNFDEALDHFDEIIDESPLNYKANFNKGNTLFRLKKYEESADIFESITDLAPSRMDKAKVFHNLGNAHLLAGKIDEAIEAYKDGLRLSPGDEDTRYNLAYAQLLKQQQQQNQPQDQENQNGQNNENNEENSDKNKEDGQKNENENDKQEDKDGDGKPDEPKNENENENGEKDKQNSGDGDKEEDENDATNQPETRRMSREEARRLLETAYRNEKALKEKLEKKKLFANGKSQKKDW